MHNGDRAMDAIGYGERNQLTNVYEEFCAKQ
jgi:hypothetical protein